MENKYQIALDFVKKSYPQGSKKWKQNVDTLQELIDIHDIDYVVFAKKILYQQKLAKALDKACELIDTKYDCPFEEYEYQFKDKRDCYRCDNKSNECWKEYLLREAQNGK